MTKHVCSNVLFVSGSISKIQKLIDIRLSFNAISPIPHGTKGKDISKWCINNWGTRSEFKQEDLFIDVIDHDNVFHYMEVKFTFDTFHSPPVGIYNKLLQEKLNVRGYFFQPGDDVMGMWESGNLIVRSIEQHLPLLDYWESGIGKALNEHFNIFEYYKEDMRLLRTSSLYVGVPHV